LLFHSFPYDFDVDLPIGLSSNVYLDNTPQEFLESIDPALADYILPGYHLPGMDLTHCCLRYSCDIKNLNKIDPTYLFFSTITALRLQSPRPLSIAGKFKIDPTGNDMDDIELFQMDSVWNPSQDFHEYNEGEIKTASQIIKIIIQDPVLGYKRLSTASIYFSQITCGFSKSYQLSFIGLFACLESLFVPEGPCKGKTLGRRISNFLKPFTFPFEISSWIEKEYRNGRNKYAHGVLDIAPSTKIRTSRIKAFGRLHEITRLCLLGFFSLESSIIQNLNSCGKRKLQTELDKLPAVTGKYLINQSPFCS